MAKNNRLNHLHNSIEDYFDDEFEDDELGYLDMISEEEFEEYLDYRNMEKTSPMGRGKKGGRGESSYKDLCDDWDDYQYG